MLENGQSCLEKSGIEERNTEIIRNDYNKNEEYSAIHPNAISDGDIKGKGTKHGGHSHYLPDCSKPTGQIDYSNFDTTQGGGLYDIEGRNDVGGRKKAMASSLYNQDYQYGAHLVNTEKNFADGQFRTN